MDNNQNIRSAIANILKNNNNRKCNTDFVQEDFSCRWSWECRSGHTCCRQRRNSSVDITRSCMKGSFHRKRHASF